MARKGLLTGIIRDAEGIVVKCPILTLSNTITLAAGSLPIHGLFSAPALVPALGIPPTGAPEP